MTAEQWGVILVLKNSEAMTQSQICELLYLEKSSVSRSIDGLEKRGWIDRQRSPHDSRSKIVMLTEKSLGVVEQCEEIAASVLQDAQQGIDDAELQASKQNLSNWIQLKIQENNERYSSFLHSESKNNGEKRRPKKSLRILKLTPQ